MAAAFSLGCGSGASPNDGADAADSADAASQNARVPTRGTTAIVGHEPSVMKPILDWDSQTQGAWLTSDGKPMRQTFTFDPQLASTVMVQTYGPWVVPDGSTYGPGHLYVPIPAASRPVRSFYFRAQLKLSANWLQPPNSGDQKLFQVWSDQQGYEVGIILYGHDGNPRFMAYSNVDPVYGAGVPLGQAVQGKKFVPPPPNVFTLDQWHTIEIVVVANTSGVSDGRLKTWVDGVVQTELDDVMWCASGYIGNFVQFDMNSLWGGQGGTLSEAQQMYVGPMHLSGTATAIAGPLP